MPPHGSPPPRVLIPGQLSQLSHIFDRFRTAWMWPGDIPLALRIRREELPLPSDIVEVGSTPRRPCPKLSGTGGSWIDYLRWPPGSLAGGLFVVFRQPPRHPTPSSEPQCAFHPAHWAALCRVHTGRTHAR